MELSWSPNAGSLTNTSGSHGGMLVSGGFSSSALTYPPSVTLQTPPPTLLPAPAITTPATVSSISVNSPPNFNLNLNANPRLLGTTHMPHPLTSLINSLHGLNKLPPSVSSTTAGSSSVYQSPEAPHNKNNNKSAQTAPELGRPKSPLKLCVASPPSLTKSAFHHVTPSLSLEESKSGASSPTSSNSRSPTAIISTNTNANPIKTGNHTKTVWRPY